MSKQDYFISKLDGQRYSRCRNGLRKLKKSYGTDDFEYIYNCEFPNEGNCIYCGGRTKFINFTNGYDTICSNCKASRKHCFIDGYAEFVKEHFYDLYEKIWNSTECIDPFDNKLYKAKSVPFSSYALKIKSKYNAHSSFWDVEKQCCYCGKTYKVSIFNKKTHLYTCQAHHGNENIFPLNLEFYGKKYNIIPEIKDFIRQLSYEEVFAFFCDYQERLKTYQSTPSFTLLSTIKIICKEDIIKYNIFDDFFNFDNFTSKFKTRFIFFNDIPIRLYYKNNKWRYKEIKWNPFLQKNVPLYCKWCGKEIKSSISYEIVVIKGHPQFLWEERLCSYNCRNEMYHYNNNYNGYVSDVENIKKRQSEKLKKKIADGTFTPCIMNSLTNKQIYCDEYPDCKFRSSWEFIFWYQYKDKIPYSNYEKLRIPYIYEGSTHNYIVDFINDKDKILYEIKPSSRVEDKKNQEKLKAAKQWCLTNGYVFKIITEKDIKDIVINENFDMSLLGIKASVFLSYLDRS